MSSKEQKTPEGKPRKKLSRSSTTTLRAVEPEVSAEQVDPRDEKLRIWKLSLAEAQKREREVLLRAKADEDNLRRRTELDIEKRISLRWKNSSTSCCRSSTAWIARWRSLIKLNPDMAPMVEGIELTLKSMLDVVRKFGVEVIGDTNVPLDPNVHQAIAMVESEDVAPGNVLGVMQRVIP